MNVFIDLDGVMVDFVRGALKWWGLGDPWNCKANHGRHDMWDLVGMERAEFVRPMQNQNFWQTLPWTEDGLEILRMVEAAFRKDIAILSSPRLGGTAEEAGKRNWIMRRLPEYENMAWLGRGQKAAFAHPNALLIDDSDDEILAWCQRGGRGILLPRLWNSNYASAGESLLYLQSCLDSLLASLGTEGSE